jgi:hypothetical protein
VNEAWLSKSTKRGEKPLARSAVLFGLSLVLVVSAGIYFRSDQEKSPAIINKDWGNCVQPAGDGGYVVAGVLWRMGGSQSYVCLVKVDAHGRKLWNRIFGQGDVSSGKSIHETADQGYIVAGTTWSAEGTHSDIYLIKTDADGRDVWRRTYGGSGKDEGHSVCLTEDGGYVTAGWTDSFGKGNRDVYLIKTDADGYEIWSRTYGGRGKDEGHSVCQTADGGYVVAGRTDSFGDGHDDVYLIKTDANGNPLWSKTFGGKGRDWGKSVRQAPDGGYIVAGTTWPFEGRYSDVLVIRTNPDGESTWHKTFGGRYGDYGYSVQPTGGGFVVAGSTRPSGRLGSSEVYLLNTDSDGSKVWSRTYAGAGSQYGFSVCRAMDGGYIVAGKTEPARGDDADIYLIKTTEDGDRVWKMAHRGPSR